MIEFLYKKYVNINKKKVFKTIAICVFACVAFNIFESIANANMFDAIGDPSNFTNLVGNGKFLENPFRANYYLDIKTVGSGFDGTFNKFGNWLANLFWGGLTIITYMLIMLFNLAFSMDISDMFKEILNTIMTSLKTAVFDEYFVLIVSIAFIYIVIAFFRNNMGQIFSKLGYIILAFAIMGMATKYSADIVSGMTTLAKSIGASSIVAISNRETTENNIGQISGELWGSLVHTPWLELEFDGKYNSLENRDSIVNTIFSLQKESEARQEYIDQLNEQNPELFKETAGSGRILPVLLITIVNVLKMFVMIVISLVQIVFQILTILFVIAFPFLLLLSMSPSFGGVNLISNWWNQILGSQLGIVLTSFLLGLLIKIDGLIATYLGGLGTYGWFGITLVQTAIYIGVILQRKQIFRVLMSIQSKVSRSSAGVWRNTMITTEKGIDGLKSVGGYAKDKVKDKTEDLKDGVRNKANSFGDKVRDFHYGHFNKETVGDRVRNYNKAKAEERRKARESEVRKESTRDKAKQAQDINSQERKTYTKDGRERPTMNQTKDENINKNRNTDNINKEENINQNHLDHSERKNTEENVEPIKRPNINDLAKNIKNNKSNNESNNNINRNKPKPSKAKYKKPINNVEEIKTDSIRNTYKKENPISKAVSLDGKIESAESKNTTEVIRKDNVIKANKKESQINRDKPVNRKIETVKPKEINSDSIKTREVKNVETAKADNHKSIENRTIYDVVETVKDVPVKKNNKEIVIESVNEVGEPDESNTIILNKTINKNKQSTKNRNIKRERKSKEEKIRKVENNERKIIINQEKVKFNISNIDRANIFRKNIDNKK